VCRALSLVSDVQPRPFEVLVFRLIANAGQPKSVDDRHSQCHAACCDELLSSDGLMKATTADAML
jgi:hypothetical protein